MTHIAMKAWEARDITRFALDEYISHRQHNNPTITDSRAILEWHSANAILDQLVKAHDARCRSYDDGGGFNHQLAKQSREEFQKLRDMEKTK